MNLVIILVGYYPEKTKQTLRWLEGIPAMGRILVANHPDIGSASRDGWTLVRGSNTAGEFSGWQEGLEWCERNLAARPGGYLFANDTACTHRIFTVFRRDALLRCLRRHRGLIGFTNQTGDRKPFRLGPHTGNRWVSSYIFFLDRASLEAISARIDSSSEIASLAPSSAQEEEFFSQDLSDNLRGHLRWWLFRGGWYRSEPLSGTNVDVFAPKLMAIFNELTLSCRCVGHGVEIRDPFDEYPILRLLDRVLVRMIRWRLRSMRPDPRRP